VGHPYIASLWLGFLFGKRSRFKGFLRHSLALFCSLPSYFQASEKSVNLGVSKVSLLFYVPILVFEWGQCYTRRFVLYIIDTIQIIANINLNIFVGIFIILVSQLFSLKLCKNFVIIKILNFFLFKLEFENRIMLKLAKGKNPEMNYFCIALIQTLSNI